MSGALINHKQLLDATDCKTKSSLEQVLRDQKVPFLYGAGGKLFTTIDAVNSAMGLSPVKPETKEIEFRR